MSRDLPPSRLREGSGVGLSQNPNATLVSPRPIPPPAPLAGLQLGAPAFAPARRHVILPQTTLATMEDKP